MVPENPTPEPLPESTPMSPDEKKFDDVFFKPLFLRDVPTSSPRTGPHAECPGEYRLAYRAVQAEVNPGDMLQIELYITGYGEISGVKLVSYTPTYFVDEKRSKVTHGMRKVNATKVAANEAEETVPATAVIWGAGEQSLDDTGLTAGLGGLNYSGWGGQPTSFFDTNNVSPKKQTPQIATEAKFDRAPFEWFFQVRDNVPPGPHDIQFYLTYYNGSEWKVDSQRITIVVRSWVRRHERLTTVLAIVAAIGAIAPGIGLLFRGITWIVTHLADFLSSFPGT